MTERVTTFADYQEGADRTATWLPAGEHLLRASLGLAGEVGEFVDHVKKARFHGHALDVGQLVAELGDVLWYLSDASRALGVPLAEVAATNVDKLRRRYPDGFSSDASRARTV